jgi:hypothetical protein
VKGVGILTRKGGGSDWIREQDADVSNGRSRANKWSDLGGVPQDRTARFARWDALKRIPYNRRSASPYNFAKSLGEVDGVQVAGYGNLPFEFFLDGGP